MKKPLKMLFIGCLIFSAITLFPVQLFAIGDDSDVVMTEVPKDDLDPDLNREGRRSLPTPILCIINEAGLVVTGISEAIISYEIWDGAMDSCMGVFFNENDFLKFLYTHHGEVMLRFETQNYYYYGVLIL